MNFMCMFHRLKMSKNLNCIIVETKCSAELTVGFFLFMMVQPSYFCDDFKQRVREGMALGVI